MMRRWRLRHLMASWVAWWLGVAAVALGPAVPALWRLNNASPGSTGEITAGLTNLDLGAKVVLDGAELWTGSVHALVAMGWLVVPPVLILVLFLRLASPAGGSVPQLPEGDAALHGVRPRERDPVQR